MSADFKKGISHGFPIALGYFSVAFGFGIMAAQAGLTVWQAVLLSAVNMTSAGQVAGVGVIAAGGTCLEMAMTQLVINLRYGLMGISLSQKMGADYPMGHRLITAFGLTDEIFAVASAQRTITPWYMHGMLTAAFISWTCGTLFGAAAGQILPTALTDAMGIVLYGMFLAIFIPKSKKEHRVLLVVCVAAACSIVFYYVLTAVSSGFAIIISTLIASTVGAVLHPIEVEAEGEVK